MPFRLKSTGVSLIFFLMTSIYLIARVLSLLTSDQSIPDFTLELMVTTTILVVVAESALQIMLLIARRLS